MTWTPEQLSPEGKALFLQAYQFAEEAHRGQRRLSGEDYIEHPLAVARILSELGADAETLAAAILHDVVEDTDVSVEAIAAKFGEEISRLVDGVTKLSRIEFRSHFEEQVSNLRRMLLAMAEDWRVVVIRLADRLHNLRTLDPLPPDRQKATARETLDIFAPLAHRMGIWRLKWELEDLSFKYLYPEEYKALAKLIAARRIQREATVASVMTRLRERLATEGIEGEVTGRAKNLYSIERKMKVDGKELEEIHDLTAVRVVVESPADCYEVLGFCHTLWKPVPGRFKDYIAMPKPNGYQSLHTTVMGPEGEPFEIQIRTKEMDRTAEYGSAAHWRYKEGVRAKDQVFEQKMSWLRQLVEWQRDLTDAREFMDALRVDVFSEEVFVFTPKSDVVSLPMGSTPLDFAYRIHTDVGNRCVGAKVNGRIVPLSHKLNTGDVVEILTSKQSAGPSRDWLDIVRTSSARSKIRAHFKRLLRDEDIERGEAALERELAKQGLALSAVLDTQAMENVLRKMTHPDPENLYAAIAYGGVSAVYVASRLKDEAMRLLPELFPEKEEPVWKTKRKPRGPEDAVAIKGMPDLLVRLARCCNPVPGDPIIGYITRGRGVSVHRMDCPSLRDYQDTERFIEASWVLPTEGSTTISYPVEIWVEGVDRPGLIADVTTAISGVGANILSAAAKRQPDGSATINSIFETRNLKELQDTMARIRQIKGVNSVNRVFGRFR